MKKLGLAALIALSLVGFQANAGFMVEPFIGYEMGEDNNSPKNDITGTNLGIRLGGSTLGFMYGFEYQMGSLTSEPPTGTSTDLDTTDMGIYVGYEFPILIRAYLTYYFSHKADAGGANDLEGDGGMKLGVSYTGLPFIVLNFETMTRSYDKVGSVTIDTETDGIMVGIGLPLP